MHPTRIFKSPEELEEAWKGYKEWIKSEGNRWTKVQYVGKFAERKEDPQKVPYTLEGFKRYCRENHGEVEQYFTNQDEYYNDFIGICHTIKEEIREDQITGGLLGVYNPSITQRLNGLTEKTDINHSGGIQIKWEETKTYESDNKTDEGA